MKKISKQFLAIWIPIMIVVSLALAGNVGKPYEKHYRSGGQTYKIETGYHNWETFFCYEGVIILLSAILFFMVNGSEKNEKEKKKV